MDIIRTIVTSPFLYIGLEIAAILVLLVFVVKWTKLQRKWTQEIESAAEKAKEDELLEKLTNSRRTK